MPAKLKKLIAAERKAWRALMNDPRVLSDAQATHDPEIKAAWERAADAEREYRVTHGF